MQLLLFTSDYSENSQKSKCEIGALKSDMIKIKITINKDKDRSDFLQCFDFFGQIAYRTLARVLKLMALQLVER